MLVLRPLRLSRAIRADRLLSEEATSGDSPWGSGKVIGALIGLTLIGLFLRLDRYGQPMFGDEISTLYIIRGNGLSGTISTVASDAEISPPLFFALAWLASKLGSAPELIRLPSMLAGVVSIPLVYLVGARALSRSTGLLAAAVFALTPFMIFYAGDGRTYSLAIALLLGSTLAMLAGVRTGRRRWWVAYGALTALAMYTHYTSAFVLGAQLIWLLWAHPEARKPSILANAGAVVLFAPWIPSMIDDFNSPTIEILSALQGDGFAVKRLAVEAWAFGYPYVEPKQVPGHLAMVAVVAGLAVAAVAALARAAIFQRERTGRRIPRPSKGMVLVFALALATPLAELVILGLTGNDLFGARNLNTSSAGLALAIGATLAAAGPLWGTIASVAVLAGFSIGAARTLRDSSDAIRFDAVADFISSRAQPGDVVIDSVSADGTPVPLTPLAIELPEPPEQKALLLPTGPPPFLPLKSTPLPAGKVVANAYREAGDHQVFIVTADGPVSVAPPGSPASVEDTGPAQTSVVIPHGAEVVETARFLGIRPINVLVIRSEPDPGSGSG